MHTIHNPINSLDYRRKLRRESTPAEILLWSRLRDKRLEGFKFRRQHGIGPYIADFYSVELGLVVEVDGDSHFSLEAKLYDERRTKYFQKHRIAVLRVTNLDVVRNIDGVLQMLIEWIEDNLKNMLLNNITPS